MPTERFDAIVIGTGQAGKPLALDLAGAGWTVAVIERAAVGGSCINYGCTPTKTMVASARVAHLARRASDYGVDAGPVRVDLARVRARQRGIVDDFRSGVEVSLEEADGIELIRGHGRFTAPREVAVALAGGGERRLSGGQVFVNTGTRPTVPELPGLDGVPFLDNASILELGEVPERLVVLGGGYVGLEFGQMFRRFGAAVTIVQRGGRLLAREDEDVADAVREILEEDGIETLLDAEAQRVEGGGENAVRLEVATPAGTRTVRGSHLLVAVGRTPNTDDLGLQTAGVATDAGGFIEADERLATSAEGIWALGDVKGGPAFTHVSYDDYRILAANLLGGGDRTTAGRLVPYAVFIDPQLGRVGITEAEARKSGHRVRVAKLPMSSVARAIESGETRGFMKALVDASDDRILGCAILGVEGGEVMSVLQAAMMGGLPYTAIRDGVFAHPTLAESLNNLFQAFEE